MDAKIEHLRNNCNKHEELLRDSLAAHESKLFYHEKKSNEQMQVLRTVVDKCQETFVRIKNNVNVMEADPMGSRGSMSGGQTNVIRCEEHED